MTIHIPSAKLMSVRSHEKNNNTIQELLLRRLGSLKTLSQGNMSCYMGCYMGCYYGCCIIAIWLVVIWEKKNSKNHRPWSARKHRWRTQSILSRSPVLMRYWAYHSALGRSSGITHPTWMFITFNVRNPLILHIQRRHVFKRKRIFSYLNTCWRWLCKTKGFLTLNVINMDVACNNSNVDCNGPNFEHSQMQRRRTWHKYVRKATSKHLSLSSSLSGSDKL